MNARTRLCLALTSLLIAACGERVQLGDDTPSTSSSPPAPMCFDLPCGQPCPVDEVCSGTDCPPSIGGYCDAQGFCSLAMPECPDASASCIGKSCGASCEPCAPGDPDCAVTTDPPMQCDAFQQCQVGPVTCL